MGDKIIKQASEVRGYVSKIMMQQQENLSVIQDKVKSLLVNVDV
jgi:hypothetical protein